MNEVIQHGAVNNLMMDADAMRKIDAVAKIMAQSEVTIPKHLKNYGDSFAVAMQAAQWGMNPFAVAQKTHLVNGILGYEAQLVNAIIISRAPVTGRLKFVWEGDWTRVNGKEDKDPSRKCIVSGTFIGDDEPSVYEVSMAQVGAVRNSPLWVADPRMQLAYLTIKRWSRLYCPDVIMGVYSRDELMDEPELTQDEKTVSGSDEAVGATQSTAEKLKHRQSQRAKPDAKKQVDEVKQTEEAKQESTIVEGTATEVVAPTETVVEAKAEEGAGGQRGRPTGDAGAVGIDGQGGDGVGGAHQYLLAILAGRYSRKDHSARGESSGWREVQVDAAASLNWCDAPAWSPTASRSAARRSTAMP